jgi:DNA-binding IclR family transcriptional regulator
MRTLQRALGILEIFSSERPSLSLQEIAERGGLAKSTAFRLVAALAESGYLLRLDDQRYCLSFRFTRLAALVQSTLSVRDVARPLMQALCDRTGETVTLNAVEGRYRICLDVVCAMSPLMSVTRTGTRSPLVDGASARVLMARLSEPQRGRVITAAARACHQPRASFAREIEIVARRGWAVTHGERVAGLTAVAALVGDADGTWPWCLTVAGPTVRLQPRERELVRLVQQAAASASRQMGAPLA